MKGIAMFLVLAFTTAYSMDVALSSLLEECRSLSYELLVRSTLIARTLIPALSVLGVLRLQRTGLVEGVKSYGLRLPEPRRVVTAILVPYIAYGAGVLISAIAGFKLVNPVERVLELMEIEPRAPLLNLPVVQLAASGIMGATINALIALGEEVGWRGFLLDEIAGIGLSPLASAVAVGVVWGLWHAPLIVLFGYNYPHHRDLVGIAAFTVFCTIWSIILSKLKRIGGLVPCAIAHGTLNALGSMMILTVDIEDEMLSMPVGIIGLASSLVALGSGEIVFRYWKGSCLRRR